VVERKESGSTQKVQHLVYFISEVLSESKTRYFHIVKLAYALLLTSTKLKHYFQLHKIEVHTSSTLGEVLHNKEATGKIAKWAIELAVYDLEFKPRTTIKAQALSNFVAKWTECQQPPPTKVLEYWTLNFDGSLQLQGARAGIVVTSPKGESFKYVLQMHFKAANNVAEYEALLHGLHIATTLGIKRLKVSGDSMLVINQANKEWAYLDEKMAAYCQELHKLENNFDGLDYVHILHGRNELADELAKIGSSCSMVPPRVFIQELHEPSINRASAKAHKKVESTGNLEESLVNQEESTKTLDNSTSIMAGDLD
jgi:ribonuclease HI